MFKEFLREIVEKTEGGVAGLVMDSAGVALETYTRGTPDFDINTIGIEFGVILAAIRRTTEALEAGTAHEVAIGTDRLVTLIRTLGEAYFLALTLKPDGNLGRGRYLMRTAAPKLLAELA